MRELPSINNLCSLESLALRVHLYCRKHYSAVFLVRMHKSRWFWIKKYHIALCIISCRHNQILVFLCHSWVHLPTLRLFTRSSLMFFTAQTLLSTLWFTNNFSCSTLLLTWNGFVIKKDGLISSLIIYVDDLRYIVRVQPWILFHDLLQIDTRVNGFYSSLCACIRWRDLDSRRWRINQRRRWHHLLLSLLTDIREHLLNLWTLEYLFQVVVWAGQLNGRCQLLIQFSLIRFEIVDLC